MAKKKNAHSYGGYAKRVAYDRRLAADAAVDLIYDILAVFMACVTFILNDLGYGQKGIETFVGKINRYIDEFCELASIEHIEQGYTKDNSVNYALTVYDRRIKDITGDVPPVVELSRVLKCLRRVH